MSQRLQQHAFPVIDILIKQAVDDIVADGEQVSCHKGCDHCCHLLVEVSWSEAMEMALWLQTLPHDEQNAFLNRIKNNAQEAKALFLASKDDKPYVGCVLDDEIDISDETHEKYFYDKKRPCAFLAEAGHCLAYDVRPSACRMHLVTSPAKLCAADVGETADYEIPDRIEEVRDEIGPINSAINREQGWGQMAIMVELALNSLEQPVAVEEDLTSA